MDEIAKTLDGMEIGECALVETDYGYHVIMRYALKENAYASDAASNWFVDQNYNIYDFLTNLKNELLLEKLAPNKEKVSVNETLWKNYQIKDAVPNYYYY